MAPDEGFRSRLVKTPSGCLEWSRARNKAGYGNLYWRGRYVNAHRVAWSLANGETSQQVLHRCDNPPCCNVEHLFLGTQSDNIRDAVAKGRAWDGSNTLRGEASPHAKLTAAEVERLRALYATGGWTHRKLAAEFGIGHGHVARIISGQKWRSIAPK